MKIRRILNSLTKIPFLCLLVVTLSFADGIDDSILPWPSPFHINPAHFVRPDDAARVDAVSHTNGNTGDGISASDASLTSAQPHSDLSQAGNDLFISGAKDADRDSDGNAEYSAGTEYNENHADGDGSASAGGDGNVSASSGGSAAADDNGNALVGGDGSATTGGDGNALAGGDGSATAGGDGNVSASSGGSAAAGGDGNATAGGDGSAAADGDGSATTDGNGSATTGDDGNALAGGGGNATTGSDGSAAADGDGNATAGGDGSATTGDDGNALAGGGGNASAGGGGNLSAESGTSGESDTDTSSPEQHVLGEDGLPLVQYMEVEDDYFDDAVFIGDSRTRSLQLYANWDNTTFLADTGLTIYTVLNKKLTPSTMTVKTTVTDYLTDHEFKKIYLMLGINELGTGTAESFCKSYSEVLDQLRALQPDAIIYLQAILHISEGKDREHTYINNAAIIERNEALRSLADNEHIFFLDSNPAVCDENGYLIDSYTFDGVHLQAKYVYLWTDYLKQHAILREEPAVFQTPFPSPEPRAIQ